MRGGGGIRADRDCESGLLLNEGPGGPPKVAARSSFGDAGPWAAGVGGWQKANRGFWVILTDRGGHADMVGQLR